MERGAEIKLPHPLSQCFCDHYIFKRSIKEDWENINKYILKIYLKSEDEAHNQCKNHKHPNNIENDFFLPPNSAPTFPLHHRIEIDSQLKTISLVL